MRTMKGTYRFQIRTYECGPDGRATLPTICNLLQEAASLNAESLGFSRSNFAAKGVDISWVLTRIVVKMRRYPAWEDVVTVETFPRGGRRVVAWRDFELKGESGEVLGVASSEWMLINLATRQLVPVPKDVFAAADPADVPVLGTDPFSRFKFPASNAASSEKFALFRAQRSHIDLNGHVNNAHYVEWMLEPCKSACPSEMEIAFRSETLAGDDVRVETTEVDGFAYMRVFSADGEDHATARAVFGASGNEEPA